MALSAANLLSAVVAARFATHPGSPGRFAIDHSRAGLWVSPQSYSQALAQRGVQLLPNPIEAPNPEVVMNSLPRREVVRQKPPATATTEHVEDSVKYLTRRVNPRSSRCSRDGEVGFYASPFGVGEVGVVCLFHAW